MMLYGFSFRKAGVIRATEHTQESTEGLESSQRWC